MPRLVDHDVRRRQVTDAARRVVAQGGLGAATFRAVAAEAGFSVRLVQYYFGDKQGLLAATHRAVIEDAAARFGAGSGRDGGATPRAVLRDILVALLPLDAARRTDAVVLAAFHAAALTSDAVDPSKLLGAPNLLVDLVARELNRPGAADDDGASGATRAVGQAPLDAELIVAAVTGLAQGMLAGQHEPGQALGLVDHLLDLLFGPVAGRGSSSRR